MATDLVAKTNPVDSTQEALHVASLIPRKRRYGTQRHTFDHTYDASQGNVPSLFDHSGFDTVAVGTERVLDKIIKDARTVIEAGPAVPELNGSILAQERATLIRLDTATHELTFNLHLVEALNREHRTLVSKLEARGISPYNIVEEGGDGEAADGALSE